MERLDAKSAGHSQDVVAENVEQLRRLFPEAFIESSDDESPRWKVDIDTLREILGSYLEEGSERFSFTWNGKSRARRIAQTTSTGTLRPCPDESVNWDTTRNIFIEGDNLEVLKLLQKSYHKKVKMIYIDPPYNTGHEFIYPDKFADNLGTYLRYTGQIDNEGFKLSANAETGGRYHTNWLNMMLPRLKLARNLLREDGAFFVTIDDNEKANLRRLLDEVFGEENFLADIAWKHTQQSKNDEPYFSRHYNSVLVYRKSATLPSFRLPRTEEDNRNYSNPDKDPNGDWRSGDVRSPNPRPNLCFPIITPSGKEILPPENGWRWSPTEVQAKIQSGEIIFSGDETKIIRKIYLSNQEGRTPENVWAGDRFGTTRLANSEIKELFDASSVFDTPKPTALIRMMIQLFDTTEQDIILDFFAGSCSTAAAVLFQSADDGISREFLCVQLPEPCDESSVAARMGLSSIAEIGKERIRRTIGKINADHASKRLNLGFRVFKLDSSNIKPWDVDFDNVEEALLNSVENIKPSRSEEDVLYELLLKYGLDLTVPMETRQVDGKNVAIIGAGALIVCLADSIGLKVVEGIAALKDEFKPEIMRVVFKDAGFADDVVKANAVQILKQAGIDDVKSL